MCIYIVNHPSSEGVNIVKSSKYPFCFYFEPWNFSDSHHRKFIKRSGKIVDPSTHSVVLRSDLYFWGEYEPASICYKISGAKGSPKYVHDSLLPVGSQFLNLPVLNASGKCHNTDPYIYGKEFYYTCCKRDASISYRSGDIILFGSLKKDPATSMFSLLEIDTVLVVDSEREVSTFPITENFYKASIIPLLLSGESIQTVVVGRTFTNIHTPFSFVPCSSNPMHTKPMHTKPIIDLTSLGITCPKVPNATIPPTSITSHSWRTILNAVKDYDLAVEFDIIG